MKRIVVTLLLLVCLFGTRAQETAMAESKTGVLSGKVVDAKTGETLIGSTVVVDENNAYAASTDMDGNFTISKVPAGKHKIKVTYIGYKVKEDDVEITPNDITKLYLSLTENAVEIKEAVVTASITKRDNESAIYIMQKNSTVIQSGISNEEMKRSPDKSSGDVIRRVSGSTIQDGKFAIIRGLSDRYNMALLNNVVMPSTEPDRKAFAFDVFPSNILDNIIIMKTGQPNLPSEWAGGIIQLNTKDVPDKSFFNVSYGTGFTEGNTFKPYKTYQGSKTDFLGFDNSMRPLPGNFPGIVDLTNLKLSNRDSLRTLGRQLVNNSWKTQNRKSAMPSQSLQLSGGFAVRKNDIQVGGIFALTYNNNIRFTEGTRTSYEGDNHSMGSDYKDERYNNTVSAAALVNLTVVIKNNHKLSWKNTYTVNSDNGIIQRDGVSYGNATEVQRTSLEYVSSKVLSTNLSGEHVFGPKKIKWRYNGGVSLINRDQPKTMRYSYEKPYTSSQDFGPNQSTDPFVYQFSNGGSDTKQSALFYSMLKERIYSAGTDVIIPINKNKHVITVGLSYQQRQRDFEARNLFIDGGGRDSMRFDRNVDNIINQQNFDNGKLTMVPFVYPSDAYTAKSHTIAAYIMAEHNIGSRFKIVYGLRQEYYIQNVKVSDKDSLKITETDNGDFQVQSMPVSSTYHQGYFSGAYISDSASQRTIIPFLPSVNMIFKINEQMNLRASYSESMSRPEFRECSPFRYYDFLRDVNLIGNVNLKQTFIHNVDFRYEWFFGKGQAINASIFYKDFTNTIELTSMPGTSQPTFIYNNAAKARLVGVELEVKKNFGFISPKVEDLVVMANLAYIYSRVDMRNVANNSSDEQVRPMQGQSPYIVNLGLSYTYSKWGTGATLLYNQSGHRLYTSGEVGNPSWYENTRPLLDLQLSQKFWKDRGIIRFTISNLLANKSIFYQNNEPGGHRWYEAGKDQVVLSQKTFRTYSLQLSFTF